MSPWGNDHSAEGISAESLYGNWLWPSNIFTGDKWRIQAFMLITTGWGAGESHLFNFQITEKYFPKCSGNKSTRERTLRSKGHEEQRKGLSADTVSYSSKCLNQLLQQSAYALIS